MATKYPIINGNLPTAHDYEFTVAGQPVHAMVEGSFGNELYGGKSRGVIRFRGMLDTCDHIRFGEKVSLTFAGIVIENAEVVDLKIGFERTEGFVMKASVKLLCEPFNEEQLKALLKPREAA